MKLPLHLLLTAIPIATAWTASSSSSAFTGRQMPARAVHFSNDAMVMYESPRDPPDNSRNGNMWAVLATTERWLSETLASQEGQDNPFTRKEVSYVCENSSEGAMITAGIFRRLREAREQGETHGQVEEERLMEKGTVLIQCVGSCLYYVIDSFLCHWCDIILTHLSSLLSLITSTLDEVFSPRTLRQTQVIVVPSNEEYMESFQTFDTLIESINQARRNARDYVTDVSLEKLDERMYGDGERDWRYAICDHLCVLNACCMVPDT